MRHEPYASATEDDYRSGGKSVGAFTEAERSFLQQRRLGRLATVGRDGGPHVTPVGMWQITQDEDAVEVTGRNFAATKKFRDVAATGRAAIVIDDILSTNPWRPCGVEIRGHAEALNEPEPRIRIHADRVISWGLEESG
jgi:pyridoxamine 5'-phosphate oxidase family protein